MELKECEILTLKEGDILLIKLNRDVGRNEQYELKNKIQTILLHAGVSRKVPVLFLTPDIDVSILRQDLLGGGFSESF